MKPWRYAFKALRRDWRAGELRVLIAALMVSVAAVSAVAWVAERVDAASSVRAANFLAADARLSRSNPFPEAWPEQARKDGLAVAQLREFPSVVLSGEQTLLVSVKAAGPGYPLRGELRLGETVADSRPAESGPPPGEVWVESAVLDVLRLNVGERLQLGNTEFTIGARIAQEPDRGSYLFSLAPRVMLHLDDLESTGLIGPGSRVRYRLLLAGEQAALQNRIRQWQREDANFSVRTPEESQPAIREVMQRARRFLGLSALLTVAVAGIAMVLAARRYATRQLDRMAIMRCLGATQGQVSRLVMWKLIWLGLLGTALGAALGFALHALMVLWLRPVLPEDMPGPGWLPLVTAVGTALVTLLGFAWPVLRRLRHVPPLRVLRRELGRDVLGSVTIYPAALGALFALMGWQAGEFQLALYVFAALLGAGLVMLLVSGALVGLMMWLRHRVPARMRFGMASAVRRPKETVLLVAAIGLGLTTLLLVTVVRQDLLGAWQTSIPPKAPNQFLINVQPYEVADMGAFLKDRLGEDPGLYPMVRGRLTAVNGDAIQPRDFDSERAERLARREFNLSWLADLPEDNRIRAGAWYEGMPEGDGAIPLSMETGIAEEMGLGLGDRLSFTVAGQQVSGEITSLRDVQWDSFRVNFFVVGPPGWLDGFPATYISSFHLPEGRDDVVPDLLRRFPSVTVIDVGSILNTVRTLVDQAVRVVQLMAGLTLVAGLAVLAAALQITGETRRFENALIRAMGATRKRLWRNALIEFTVIGALAGLVAGGLAGVAGQWLGWRLFQLEGAVTPTTPLLGILLGVLVVGVVGTLGVARFLGAAPMRVLRASEDG